MLGLVTFLVRDYDEAASWFVDRLGFVLREDKDLGAGKRWVVVGPRQGGAALLLAEAANAPQANAIGTQAGGRVFLFLYTEDFARDHAAMTARGVRFLEAPRREDYGIVAKFADLYGGIWDLIEPERTAQPVPPLSPAPGIR